MTPQRATLTRPIPFFHMLLPLMIALMSLALSGYAGYNANDKTTSNRVTAVEVLQKADHDNLIHRLERIENKQDKLMDIVLELRRR